MILLENNRSFDLAPRLAEKVGTARHMANRAGSLLQALIFMLRAGYFTFMTAQAKLINRLLQLIGQAGGVMRIMASIANDPVFPMPRALDKLGILLLGSMFGGFRIHEFRRQSHARPKAYREGIFPAGIFADRVALAANIGALLRR